MVFIFKITHHVAWRGSMNAEAGLPSGDERPTMPDDLKVPVNLNLRVIHVEVPT
jgi:hypothetical protein